MTNGKIYFGMQISFVCVLSGLTGFVYTRDVHLVTSWDDKGPVKIQKALEFEFDTFISGVKDVRYISVPRFSIISML